MDRAALFNLLTVSFSLLGGALIGWVARSWVIQQEVIHVWQLSGKNPKMGMFTSEGVAAKVLSDAGIDIDRVGFATQVWKLNELVNRGEENGLRYGSTD